MRAKELLAAGVKPIEVAPSVGLYDQSQLNRHFRRLVGMTPGAYARAHAT
jgi:AraC-like DNA-binding protein